MYQTKALVSLASLFLETGDTYQAIMYYERLLDLEQELTGNISNMFSCSLMDILKFYLDRS